MTPPEPRPNRLRPDQTSGPRQILTESAPALAATTARPLVQMPTTAAPRDLAYTTALVAACQRMWAAPDVAALWRTVVDEAVALVAADGAALVTYTEGFWQTLAAHPGDAAPDDFGDSCGDRDALPAGATSATNFDRRSGGRRLRERAGQTRAARGAYWEFASAGGPVGVVCQTPGHSLAVWGPSRGIRPPRQFGLQSRYRTRQLKPSSGRTASRRTGPRNLDDPPSAHGRPGIHSAETPLPEHPREATNNRSNGHPDRRPAGWHGE
jgi:hypothetical protein